MWNILYMDMYKTGANNTSETLMAVGGGAERPRNLTFRRLVCLP